MHSADIHKHSAPSLWKKRTTGTERHQQLCGVPLPTRGTEPCWRSDSSSLQKLLACLPSLSPHPTLPCPVLFLTPTLSAGVRPPPPLPQPAGSPLLRQNPRITAQVFHLMQPPPRPQVGPDFFMPSASTVCCTLAAMEHICLVIIISQHPRI